MKTALVNPPHIIASNAEAFARFLKLRAQAAALSKEADLARAEAGIPDTETIVAQLGLESPGDKGEAIVYDGNNKPLGKLSVSYRNPYQVAGGFVSRVS